MFTHKLIISWIDVLPLVKDDAVVGVTKNAAFGVGEEHEPLQAAHLDKAMIRALIELVTVALVRDINFVIAFATL